ncbi:MAG: 2,3-bisphosphoglycerate-independent phosphoglycerate mutase [Candidatus Dojkabacteria bacterium]
MSDQFKRPKPVVMISMDGVGVAPQGPGNAVMLADTVNLDKFWPLYPHTYLEAAGLHVGLPPGTDGNSEVGHMTIGSGRVIYQNLPRIDNAINNGSFFQNPEVLKAFEHVKETKGNVHVMGIVGNGLVHGSVDHLMAILKFAVQEKIDPDKLFIHAFTDGRDSAPNSALEVLDKVAAFCIQKRMGRIATIVGRAYAMDRNRNWARTKIAYDLLVEGKGKIVPNYKQAVEESYKNNVFDEYIDPIAIVPEGEQQVKIEKGDTIIFFNFRPDRAVQLTMAFEDKDFKGFERTYIPDVYFIGMVTYENGFPTHMAFPPEKVTTPLGKVISDAGLKQLRIAESEKFPHVTYFFNGQNKEIYPGETWLEVPSPKDVATYDQKPEMSQKLVTDMMVDKIEKEDFDFILVNFAGPDMVAHTGVIDAAVKAMEVCDQCVGRIVEAVLKKDGVVIMSSDHGNTEEMIDLQTGSPDTKHSTNPVPFILIKNGLVSRELPVGGLADIAPTILGVMGLEIPAEMTGRDLLS